MAKKAGEGLIQGQNKGWRMTANDQPGNETPHRGNKGEGRPLSEEHEKLEDKIADEKDDEMAADQRKSDS